jgi:hypothetical protein
MPMHDDKPWFTYLHRSRTRAIVQGRPLERIILAGDVAQELGIEVEGLCYRPVPAAGASFAGIPLEIEPSLPPGMVVFVHEGET